MAGFCQCVHNHSHGTAARADNAIRFPLEFDLLIRHAVVLFCLPRRTLFYVLYYFLSAKTFKKLMYGCCCGHERCISLHIVNVTLLKKSDVRIALVPIRHRKRRRRRVGRRIDV